MNVNTLPGLLLLVKYGQLQAAACNILNAISQNSSYHMRSTTWPDQVTNTLIIFSQLLCTYPKHPGLICTYVHS